MADIELVQIVKKGRDALAAWREEHPNQFPLGPQRLLHEPQPHPHGQSSGRRHAGW